MRYKKHSCINHCVERSLLRQSSLMNSTFWYVIFSFKALAVMFQLLSKNSNLRSACLTGPPSFVKLTQAVVTSKDRICINNHFMFGLEDGNIVAKTFVLGFECIFSFLKFCVKYEIINFRLT